MDVIASSVLRSGVNPVCTLLLCVGAGDVEGVVADVDAAAVSFHLDKKEM